MLLLKNVKRHIFELVLLSAPQLGLVVGSGQKEPDELPYRPNLLVMSSHKHFFLELVLFNRAVVHRVILGPCALGDGSRLDVKSKFVSENVLQLHIVNFSRSIETLLESESVVVGDVLLLGSSDDVVVLGGAQRIQQLEVGIHNFVDPAFGGILLHDGPGKQVGVRAELGAGILHALFESWAR